jgi:hypothetical protein
VSEGDWRDRQLIALPASARLEAVSLFDLATGKAIWAWGTPIPAGAAPVPASRDSDIAALADGWRSLKALRFGPSSFSAADGPGGPWKYRLDGTFLLPAGGKGDARTTHSLLLTSRLGGTEQWAGAAEFDCAFQIEQPLIDALWTLTYGDRDPGAPNGRP